MSQRILVLSEVRLLRDALVEALGRHPTMRVVAAASQAEALARCDEDAPNVVLIDSAMSKCEEVIRMLLNDRPELIVIAIGTDQLRLLRCAEAGAAGFVPREGSI
ncbi:MAG TPA: response regulator, partial [Gemmatimonadaceae bacterium]|nr:response regulator [Gemmatimonadaceae bacterium]